MTSPRSLGRHTLLALSLIAAASATSVATSGPAAALTADCNTRTVVTVNGHTKDQVARYGDPVNVQASVAPVSCSVTGPMTVGTLTLKRTTDGTHWTNLRTINLADGLATLSVTGRSGGTLVPRIAEFRATYAGATDDAHGVTYENSADKGFVFPIRSATEKRSVCGRTGCRDTWKVSPVASIRGLRAPVRHKVGRTWKKIGTVRIGSTGKFTYTFRVGVTRVYLPSARGYWTDYIQVTVRRVGRVAARGAALVETRRS